jgi:hypothetical protein
MGRTTTQETAMTISKAIETARERTHMFRQGRGWVTSRYDETKRWSRLSQEMSYSQARQHVKECRVGDALELLGVDADDACYAAIECVGRYEDIVRAAIAKARGES